MSKEIVKHKRYPDTVVIYLAPHFGHVMSEHIYARAVGSLDDHLCPWNASSPLAKKEYGNKYKRWGQVMMADQWNNGDNR